MAEKKYELHIWYNRWVPMPPPAARRDRGSRGYWLRCKVLLRYENDRQRDNQADCILCDGWWHRGRLIPFRDVLRMERREADE